MDSTEKSHIDRLIEKLLDKSNEDPMKFGDQLVRIGGEEIQEKLIHVLKSGEMDDAFLATKVLSMMDNKELALDALFEVIHRPANQHQNGGLVSLVEEFDIIDKFVDLFRVYLLGISNRLHWRRFIWITQNLTSRQEHSRKPRNIGIIFSIIRLTETILN